MSVDSIRLSVLWNRLIATVDEAAGGLVRSCYSPNVREYQDYCVGIFDRTGRMLAHSTQTTSGFIGVITPLVKDLLRIFDGDIKEGDVYITNDPWMATGHLLDITLARPLFHRGEMIGFAVCIVHHSDIGGRMSDLESRDIYEEGIQIPPLKYVDAGRENDAIVKLVTRNVRTPHKVNGDLHAQRSALHICERGLGKILDDYPGRTIEGIADQIMARSEESMLAAMRAIPAGTYRANLTLPPIGRHPKPIPLVLAIDISADHIRLDFTGSSPEIAAAANSPINYAKGYAYYALKQLLDPHVPNNDGCIAPFEFIAPPGSILNCQRPAPTWGRSVVSHYLPEMVFEALSGIMPERVIAACGSAPASSVVCRGRRYDGQDFLALQSDKGGYGASATADGKDCLCYPHNVANIPIEVTENESALVYLRKELMCDSGGPGRRRGGLGQVVEVQIADGAIAPIGDVILVARGSPRGEDSLCPVSGILGGTSGRGTALELNGKPLVHGSTSRLKPGDRVRLELPGGGGYGDPKERERERVIADVRDGRVSIEAARADYGVTIDPDALILPAVEA